MHFSYATKYDHDGDGVKWSGEDGICIIQALSDN